MKPQLQKKRLVFIHLLLAWGAFCVLTNFRTSGQTADQQMEAVFQKAVKAYGAKYLELERQLLSTNSVNMLESHLKDADPMVRLLAQGLLNAKKQPEPLEATKYLDSLPARYAGTVRRYPSPSNEALELRNRYDARIAEFIAVRLVKERGTAFWRLGSYLLYLELVKKPSTTSGLIRFITETKDEKLAQGAVSSIKTIGDPALPAKLKEERKRMEEQGGKWPTVLNTLTAGAPGEVKAAQPEMFPIIPPIADADPSIRHPVAVEVPSAMDIVRKGDALTVIFSKLQTTNLTVGQKMVTGMMREESIYIGGVEHGHGMSLEGGLAFGLSTNVMTLGREELPAPGEEFIFEHRVTMFETDVPTQHMWSPQGGKHYKVLWTRTFRENIK